MVSFDDFQKIDLRVAKVIKAERLEGSEKLLKLEVDLGEEKRKIVAGIGKFYEPKHICGKEIILVCNLEPKKIFGYESKGMLLAADNEGEPVLLIPEKKVPPGSKVK